MTSKDPVAIGLEAFCQAMEGREPKECKLLCQRLIGCLVRKLARVAHVAISDTQLLYSRYSIKTDEINRLQRDVLRESGLRLEVHERGDSDNRQLNVEVELQPVVSLHSEQLIQAFGSIHSAHAALESRMRNQPPTDEQISSLYELARLSRVFEIEG